MGGVSGCTGARAGGRWREPGHTRQRLRPRFTLKQIAPHRFSNQRSVSTLIRRPWQSWQSWQVTVVCPSGAKIVFHVFLTTLDQGPHEALDTTVIFNG